MTSSLPPKAPLSILQADHTSMKTSEERVSQPARNGEQCRTQPPASKIHWDSSTIFPFKNCHALAESLELASGHESAFFSYCWFFWLKHLSFLLTLASLINGFWVAGSQTWVWWKKEKKGEKEKKNILMDYPSLPLDRCWSFTFSVNNLFKIIKYHSAETSHSFLPFFVFLYICYDHLVNTCHTY